MRKLTRLALLLTLTIPLMAASCNNLTTKHKLAIFTAQSDAALTAITEGSARLAAAGRLKPEAAKSIYTVNLRATNGIDVLRSRAKSGFDKKEALVVIDNLIADVRKAESDGVIGLSGADRDRFLRITFFAQFTLRSVKSVIEAVKPPQDAGAEVRAALAASAQADGTVATDLVLILQTAVLRGIAQSRMTEEEAFADGALLHNELVARLGGLGG